MGKTYPGGSPMNKDYDFCKETNKKREITSEKLAAMLKSDRSRVQS